MSTLSRATVICANCAPHKGAAGGKKDTHGKFKKNQKLCSTVTTLHSYTERCYVKKKKELKYFEYFKNCIFVAGATKLNSAQG